MTSDDNSKPENGSAEGRILKAIKKRRILIEIGTLFIVAWYAWLTHSLVVLNRNAYRSSKLIPNATLKVYPGEPHAMTTTSKGQVNEDLLAFIRK